MRWQVLIVDDEAPARLNLECALAQHPQWQVAGSCKNAAEAREFLGKQTVDLVFLDIRMPHESGLQFAESICQSGTGPLIVFVTAYDEHALAAFEVYALDYILKPFDDERFARTLQQAEQQLLLRKGSTPQTDQSSDVLRFVREQQAVDAGEIAPALDYVVVRSVGSVERIRVADILWLASAGNYVELHMDSRRVLHRSTMAQLEKRLSPLDFMRVHRTAIVRRSAVSVITVEGDGQYAVTLSNGARVPVSERFIAEVRAEVSA